MRDPPKSFAGARCRSLFARGPILANEGAQSTQSLRYWGAALDNDVISVEAPRRTKRFKAALEELETTPLGTGLNNDLVFEAPGRTCSQEGPSTHMGTALDNELIFVAAPSRGL